MQHLAAKSILPKNSERLIAIRTWAICDTGTKGVSETARPAGSVQLVGNPEVDLKRSGLSDKSR